MMYASRPADDVMGTHQSAPEIQEDENLITRLLLRLHAANLPCNGILRNLPTSYAEVTSIRSKASRSGPHYNDDANVSAATIEWGHTETIQKNRNPQWTTTFEIDYEYGSECYFSIKVYRKKNKDNDEPVSLGTAMCEVGDILGSKNRTRVKRLPRGGVVFCRLEAVNGINHNHIARFQFQAFIPNNKKSFLSKLKSAPDTIFQISKRHPNAHRNPWLVVYRSSPVNESFEPKWDPAEMNLEHLCNGDFERPLRLRVLLQKGKRSGNVCIGECETTLGMIMNTQKTDVNDRGFNLFKSIERQETVIGRLEVPLAQVIDLKLEQEAMIDSFRLNSACDDMAELAEGDPFLVDISGLSTSSSLPLKATFSHYINHGWLLDFMVAIDFTSSNGDPRVPGSLHDCTTEGLNDYEECIESIGGALGRYSEACTIWGFGAKFDGVTRHLFQLGNIDALHDGSVDSILQAYRNVFQSDLIMSGPTLFDQVIQAAAVRANKSKTAGASRYSVLLILTDGISDEIEETKRKLNVYSSMPLSVIFVGLGRSDFCAMHKLSAEVESNRKISSFVEYRKNQHDPMSLGAAALESLPGQFLEYMTMNNIHPLAPG